MSKRGGFFSKWVKNLVTVAASGDRNWVSKVEEKDFSFFENHVYIYDLLKHYIQLIKINCKPRQVLYPYK